MVPDHKSQAIILRAGFTYQIGWIIFISVYTCTSIYVLSCSYIVVHLFHSICEKYRFQLYHDQYSKHKAVTIYR